jgi:hypothetical protein
VTIRGRVSRSGSIESKEGGNFEVMSVITFEKEDGYAQN